MHPQRLEQASLPALALPSEHANRRRDLRPRHRIRNERHRVRETMLAQISVQSHNEVHVFRDTASAVSTYREQMGAFKESERARNDQVSAQSVPPQAPEQESAEILENLHRRQDAPVDACLEHAAMLDHAGVRDANRSADRGDWFA